MQISSDPNIYIRVSHMCQKFKSSWYAVKFPLLTSSYLYRDQKIGIFLMFKGTPKWFSVLLYSLLVAIWVKSHLAQKIYDRDRLAS